MDSKSLVSSLIDMAARVEHASAQFYQKASKRFMEDEARLEFQKLASMELEHEDFFSDLKLKYKNQAVTTIEESTGQAISKYVKAVQDARVFDFGFILNHTVTGHEKVPEIIQLAIGFEKDSIVFYAGLANIIENEILSKLLKQIIREEFDHLSLLTNIAFL